jgi:glycosyltransferase involved in cell wall biosynthesis
MRVLHVIDSLRSGGAEALLTGLVPRMMHLGVMSDIFVLERSGSSLEQEAQRWARILGSERGRPYSLWTVLRLREAIRDGDYEIVHSHLFPAQMWVPLALALSRRKPILVTTEHSTNNRRRGWRWFKIAERWMYKHYDAAVCVSDAVAASLQKWVPEAQPKVRVIPNGVDTRVIQEAGRAESHEIGGPLSGPAVISVGRFEPAKDYETLLRALARIPVVQALLVGDGSKREAMEDLASTLGLKDRVRFLGERRDVYRLLKAADVFVQSSRWEGFGLAAVEAMAAGLPVVASRVSGLADVVGDAGLTFPAGDVEALAACLERVLEDDELRDDLIVRSLKRAKHFDLSRTAEQYASLYKDLANRPQRNG